MVGRPLFILWSFLAGLVEPCVLGRSRPQRRYCHNLYIYIIQLTLIGIQIAVLISLTFQQREFCPSCLCFELISGYGDPKIDIFLVMRLREHKAMLCFGWLLASHVTGTDWNPGQSMWDFWWTECYWDRLPSSTSVFPLQLSLHQCSVHIYAFITDTV